MSYCEVDIAAEPLWLAQSAKAYMAPYDLDAF